MQQTVCHWLTCLVLPALYGSTSVSPVDIDPLFSEHSTLEVTISAPLSEIMRHRKNEEYRAGTLSYSGQNGRNITLEIGVRPRAQFRRRIDICDFVPLRINFRKSQVHGTVFENQDKLKLVTHCKPTRTYEQALISEYLVYRVFNILTDMSYRARLMRINYIDTARGNREFQSYGFFIEDDLRLAQRQRLRNAETRRVSVRRMQPEQANLVSVFNYFIGNMDFSHVKPEPEENCCHNESILTDSSGTLYPVPYDFDMSAFVNGPHRSPAPRPDFPNFRGKWRYMGWCLTNDHLTASIGLLTDKRTEIYELIRNQTELEDFKRKSLFKFLDRLYRSVDTPRKVEKNLVADCQE